MSVRMNTLIITGVVALLSLSNAARGAECPKVLPEAPSAAQFVACLKELRKQVVPSGGVMAFDLTDGCPEGWKRFEKGAARVVVGAGNFESDVEQKFALDERNRPLVPYAFHEHGGEQLHQLTVEEMPEHSHNHSHKVRITFGSEGPQGSPPVAASLPGSRPTFEIPGYGSVPTDESRSIAGGIGAHNNMPPYIALYFCKKD